jgi:hypothetical protein
MVKQISHTAIVLMAIIAFASCSKENSAPAGKSSVAQASATEPSVITPFGLMPQSKVHFIGGDFAISVQNGRVQKVERATGKLVEDFGPVTPLDDNLNLGKKAVAAANSRVPAASGWIDYTYWQNPDTLTPITYFTTNWIVPPVPKTQSSQTIFLFNGMQDGTTSTSYIVQPVLQWGSSAAGGGKYWAVTNWYVSSANAYYGKLVTVSAGTALQGTMTETGVTKGLYSYNSSFVGSAYSTTDLQVNNVPQAYWAAETLETYGITNANTEYPNATDIGMTSIQIETGKTNPTLKWTAVKTNSTLKSVVVSNANPGGSVDLYF